MAAHTLLPIACITRAHGIRGEVSVECHADSPRFLQGEIYLRTGAAPPARQKVASWRKDNARLLLRFAGVEDRSAAERLRGAEILVPADALPQLDGGEFYLHQLLGLSIIEIKEDGSESPVGSLESIDSPAGQELWTIRTPAGEEKLFPAVPEFVRDIDLDKGEARITPPPGLFDL